MVTVTAGAAVPPVTFVPRPAAPAPMSLAQALRVVRACAAKTETVQLTARISTVDKSKKRGQQRDQFSRVVVMPHSFRKHKAVVAFVQVSKREKEVVAYDCAGA